MADTQSAHARLGSSNNAGQPETGGQHIEMAGVTVDVNSPPPDNTSPQQESHTLLQTSHLAAVTAFRKVSFLSKLRILLTDPKTMTNKAAEICITLFALFVIVELNNVPKQCDNLYTCLDLYVAEGGDLEPDFALQSCAAQRRDCFLSKPNELVDSANSLSQDLLDSLAPYVAFCDCILEDNGNVYCEFRVSTFCFLLAGIFVMYLLEITTEADAEDKRDVNNGPRRFSLALLVVYFAVALWFYSNAVSCDSAEFDELKKIVVFVSFACLIICGLVLLTEEFGRCANRGRQQKQHEERQQQEAQKHRELVRTLTRVVSRAADSMSDASSSLRQTPRGPAGYQGHETNDPSFEGLQQHHGAPSDDEDGKQPTAITSDFSLADDDIVDPVAVVAHDGTGSQNGRAASSSARYSPLRRRTATVSPTLQAEADAGDSQRTQAGSSRGERTSFDLLDKPSSSTYATSSV